MYFEKALNFVLGIEGGYVDDPHDSGGKTRWGVTEAVARAHGYTGDMKNYPLEYARKVYEQDYWDKVMGNSLPWPMCLYLFDMAVNSGPVPAIKTIQSTLHLKQDGILGPITLDAIRRMTHDQEDLFLADRAIFYTTLASFKFHGRGWFKRLFRLAHQ